MAENTTSVKPPFSIAELRESQEFLKEVAPEINEAVTYGRPDATQWFRIHPDSLFEAAIFEHVAGDKKTDHPRPTSPTSSGPRKRCAIASSRVC